MKNFASNFSLTSFSHYFKVIAHIIDHYAPNSILQNRFWCNFWKNQAVKILFGIKWKDVWKNDKLRQIFRGVPNIPNHLECFNGRHNIHICVSNIPGYKMIPESLKLTVYFWKKSAFQQKMSGQLNDFDCYLVTGSTLSSNQSITAVHMVEYLKVSS